MTPDERALAQQRLAQTQRRASLLHFGLPWFLAGCGALALGLAVIWWFSDRYARVHDPAQIGAATKAMLIVAGLAAIAGLALCAFAIMRWVLGSLAHARGRDNLAQTIALLRAELNSAQVEQIDANLLGATPLDQTIEGSRLWIARVREGLLAIDGRDIPGASGPGGILLSHLRLVVLPTTRTVLHATTTGAPLPPAPGTPIPEADVPAFARGYRLLRLDHFPPHLHDLLPTAPTEAT